MDNPHVMSKYANELDCLRARDKWYQEQLDSLRRQLVEVTQQRDELVKVLKRLPKVNKDIYIGKSKISYAQEVQAAIAKLGAGETAHNAKGVGLADNAGESHTTDGLCVAVDTEKET